MKAACKFSWLCAIWLLLSACSNHLPPLQQAPAQVLPQASATFALTWHTTQQPVDQQYLLVIQQLTNSSRWSLFDPIGIPVARQQLVGKKWQAEGLLPPNRQALVWLNAILFAVLDDAQATAVFGELYLNSMQRSLENYWRVSYLDHGAFIIEFSDASQLTVMPVDMQ